MLEGVVIPAWGAPEAPCMRHTFQPLTAGAQHGFLDRFEVARQRFAR
jgi:hypothetical protein